MMSSNIFVYSSPDAQAVRWSSATDMPMRRPSQEPEVEAARVCAERSRAECPPPGMLHWIFNPAEGDLSVRLSMSR